MTLRLILEFVGALAFLIVIHELGHFIACRVLGVEVEEFGLGLPPKLFRFWRLKGSMTVGRHRLEIPRNFELPFDTRSSLNRGADAIAQRANDRLVLKSISLVATEDGQYFPPASDYVTLANNEVRISGVLKEISPGTEFTINALPLGGFVRPKGENDPEVFGGLAAAPAWKRVIVALAGPVMNLLAALVFLVYTFGVYGNPVAIQDQVQIAAVDADSPAQAAGLRSCDIINSVNGQPVYTHADLSDIISRNLDQPVTLAYTRNDQAGSVSLVPRSNPPEGRGAMGVQVSNRLTFERLSAGEVLPASFSTLASTGYEMINLPIRMLSNQIAPEEGRLVGLKGMYDIYAGVRTGDLFACAPQPFNVLNFLITLTVSLGMLNLLPIPALDGGRILFALPELIVGRRISPQYESFVNLITFVSFMLLIGALLFVNFRDFINPVQFP
ncbi:MAG: M50 family metallopeptidase [Chloroflexota bacterium]